METTSVIFDDVGRVFGALSAGDLSQRITRDYAGTFGQVKDDANATSEKLAGHHRRRGPRVLRPGQRRPEPAHHPRCRGHLRPGQDRRQQQLRQAGRIIGEVRAAADALTGAANQVSATAQSCRSRQRAGCSVEETTASIDLMSASISQNSDNAKVTDGMATKASKEAGDGRPP
jgi:methyl-accepting chemotaxis protein